MQRCLEIVDYTIRKVTPNIKRANVKGGAQPVREKEFTPISGPLSNSVR